MNSTLVVIPTYNEKENVGGISHAVLQACPEADVLFVDDNSPDGTGKMADDLAAAEPRIHVLHRPGKSGLGRAYIAGFQWALQRHYEFIFEMDADFSHNPQEIAPILKAAQASDLALGSRYVGGIRIVNWPLSRLMLSESAAIYVRLITGMPFSDPTGGFKCYRRAVLETIDLEKIKSNGYSFQVEMTHTTWRLGFKIVEVPIIFEDRRSGHSKMNSDIVKEALWMVWKLLFRCRFHREPGPVHPRSVAARGGAP
ncbi:MAG: polyprenol monophosphomannose synthase [Lentisphaerota bacterium]